MKNKKSKIGHLITHIQPRFIAEEQTIEAEDYLLEINGQTIEAVFDYRFSFMQGNYITLTNMKLLQCIPYTGFIV